MAVQRRNSEMVDLLAADFQLRYEPQFALKSAVSQHLALPGLRGFWPTSSFDENGNLYDLSGQGHTATLNGNGYYQTNELVAAVGLDGAGDYFSIADPGAGSWMDITGLESYVAATHRGLTLGGWFRFTNAAAAAEFMISKWDVAGNQRSYALNRAAAGGIAFNVSLDGTAVTSVTSTGAPAALEWFFAAARFDPSAELKVWYNADSDTNVAAIPASIHAGTANFNIGARHNGLQLMTGRLSKIFLCAALLPDAVVGQLFHQTRAMFGV